MASNHPKAGVTEPSEMRARLLAVVDRLAQDVEPRARTRHRLRPESRFDRDLGLDSLSRAELLMRVEQAFGVDLPESAIQAESPAELLEYVLRAPPSAAGERASQITLLPAAPADRPERATTLMDALEWHVDTHPERIHLTLLDERGRSENLSYQILHQGACRVAAGLHARGVSMAHSVALMLPTALDYFQAFFGVLYAGAIPVPIYPPSRASQLAEHLRRHGRILHNAQVTLLVTVPEARRLARLLRGEAPALRTIVTVAELKTDGEAEPVRSTGDTLALLQYTSGSTGDPKGVMLTHAQIMANIRALGERLDVGRSDVVVSWLPLYHDMGLIGTWLSSLYFGVPFVVMSPQRFLAHPLQWLQAVHRFRGTISGGPNFGFELCLRHLDSGPELPSLDLSCWRVAFNGAEPVSPGTLKHFAQRFARFDFRAEALMPVYGLAEAGVGLCVPHPDRGATIERVDREAFARSAVARPVKGGATRIAEFVSCGPPLPGYEIRVVGEAGREMPDRREGDIEFRGPSATHGYFNRADLSAALFDGDWLRTGDRGYLAGGDIHITGRTKEMMVRGGRNLYPYELEEAVGAIPGIRKGCVAVFGNVDEGTGVEQLVVIAETREIDAATRQALVDAICATSVDIANLPADDIVLVSPHSVLKTSSGKLRRGTTRDLYRAGLLGQPGLSVRRELLRLAARARVARLWVRLRRGLEWIYAGYAWSVFAISAIVLAPCIVVSPGYRLRWMMAHAVARAVPLVCGVRINRKGVDRLPPGPCVLVVNHASYIDAPVVVATLRSHFRFVAKAELANAPILGTLLARFGVIFVERFDVTKAAQASDRVLRALEAGQPIAFFPEGTFTRSAGLRAFHMGAFVAAARASVSVVPIALRGTRSIMRGAEWFPRPGTVTVSVGPPLVPGGASWDDALDLRERARSFILSECGEPDALER
ncbi:MAG TPA: AMP-binding protein [Gammaproteobacteria bacterium]|nr:AMP-binding protein [Gammaproteobacteria bacterium]